MQLIIYTLVASVVSIAVNTEVPYQRVPISLLNGLIAAPVPADPIPTLSFDAVFQAQSALQAPSVNSINGVLPQDFNQSPITIPAAMPIITVYYTASSPLETGAPVSIL